MFSIVTPNYNMGRFLQETIESVLRNLRPGDEYYIIDGGSADGSIDIIRSYEKYLAGWISEPDSGYADAISKGFKYSKKMFQCWINSGDLLLRGALAIAEQTLLETGADMIFGDDLYIDDQSRVIKHSSGYVKSLRGMMLFGGWTPLQDSCFWRRSLYERIGGIDVNLKNAADFALFLKMSCYGRCEYSPTIFSAFRKHCGQKSIRNVKLYNHERETFRLRTLKETKQRVTRKLISSAYYQLAVRWRAYAGRHLHRSTIPTNAKASALSAQSIKNHFT